MDEEGLDDLVARALEKDRTAIRALCAALAPSILATARAILGPSHAALDDVGQEALIATIRQLRSLHDRSGVQYFARRIAANRALETLRNQRRALKKAENYGATELAHGPDPAHAYDATELRDGLRRVLAELSPIASEVLILHYVLGHSVQEIAASLGKPENTIWGRLQAAKAALRGRLANDRALRDWFAGSGDFE